MQRRKKVKKADPAFQSPPYVQKNSDLTNLNSLDPDPLRPFQLHEKS